MDVFDIAAEICDRFFGRLVREAIRVMYIPERGDLAHIDAIEQFFQPFRVRIHAVRLDKQRDSGSLCTFSGAFYSFHHEVVVDLTGRSRIKIGKNAYVRSV